LTTRVDDLVAEAEVGRALAVVVPMTSAEMARAHTTDRFTPQWQVAWSGSGQETPWQILIRM
jgi:hypothetical protein